MPSLKRLALSVHLYLGLFLTAPLAVIASTGLLLGWSENVRLQLAPYRMSTVAQHTLSPPELAACVQREFKKREINALFLPETNQTAARARLSTGETIFINPENGHALEVHGHEQTDWIEFLYRLHRGKILGFTGQVIMSATGALTFLLLVLGIYIRKSGTRMGGRLTARVAHSTLGFPIALAIGAVILTGALFNFSTQLTQWLDPVPNIPKTSSMRSLKTLEELWQISLVTYSGAPLRSIHFPKDKLSPIQFYYRDSSRVFIDPATGAVLKASPWSSHWTRSLWMLHSGKLFGEWRSLWTSLVASMLLTLLGTGLLLAKQRLYRRGRVNA